MEEYWYNKHPIRFLLWPFSLLFIGLSKIRRKILSKYLQNTSQIPLIVVGNITVGGVGKTPLVIALAKAFTEKGLKVGVVSRGFGAFKHKKPYLVREHDDSKFVGDEPLLIAKNTACPLVLCTKRSKAVAYLEANFSLDLILSDDGLQHYAMGRAIEIAVIDGTRGFGNGLCLPAGPLRESISRLDEVDFIVVNEKSEHVKGYAMAINPLTIKQLISGKSVTIEGLKGTIAAFAALGNPKRFFNTLKKLGLDFNTYVYPDHYAYKEEDFHVDENLIIMTEKDAVKCHKFAKENMYYLAVEAQLEKGFWEALCSHEKLQSII